MTKTDAFVVLFFLSGTLILAATARTAGKAIRQKCPSPYGELNPGHTMCMTDKGKDLPLTSSDVQAILERHNWWRQRVSPKAANMQKLVWDPNLAKVAAKWSRQCTVGHDKQRAEPALPGISVGQNFAAGVSNILEAVNKWAQEVENFTYGVYTTKIVGHYTQIINAKTSRVGCGQADCSRVPGARFQRFHVCNYASGQTPNDSLVPYKKSMTSCSDCSTKCDTSGTLCDCGGKVCYNDGSLNVATCMCTCSRGYTGTQCQTKICPGKDTRKCKDYVNRYANPCIYDNVLKEECPYHCGFCP